MWPLLLSALSQAATRPALPGACVPVPAVSVEILEHRSIHGYSDYLQRQFDEERSYRWAFETTAALDLDGDGVLDMAVPVLPHGAQTCPRAVTWALYVVRPAASCGHLVGEVRGPLPTPAAAGAPAEAGGLAPLTLIEPRGPALGDATRRYVFDGTTYRVADESVAVARCAVHPDDCRPATEYRCEATATTDGGGPR